jgi:hypothetical protein
MRHDDAETRRGGADITGGDRITRLWGARTPYGPGEEWPVRVDSHLQDGLAPDDVDRWVPATSTLHSNGDAMDLAVKDGRIVGVRGRATDRVNRGRLDRRTCSAGRRPPPLTG